MRVSRLGVVNLPGWGSGDLGFHLRPITNYLGGLKQITALFGASVSSHAARQAQERSPATSLTPPPAKRGPGVVSEYLTETESNNQPVYKAHTATKPNKRVQARTARLVFIFRNPLLQLPQPGRSITPRFSGRNGYHAGIPSQSVSYFEFHTPNLLPSINIILCNV